MEKAEIVIYKERNNTDFQIEISYRKICDNCN